MPGSTFYMKVNGRRFAIPEDQDMMITVGGLTNKNDLRNGDGSVDFQKSVVPGSVRGIAVRLRRGNGDLEALQSYAGQEGLSVVIAGPDGPVTGVGGFTFGDDGLKKGLQEGKSEEFDFYCANGQPLELA